MLRAAQVAPSIAIAELKRSAKKMTQTDEKIIKSVRRKCSRGRFAVSFITVLSILLICSSMYFMRLSREQKVAGTRVPLSQQDPYLCRQFQCWFVSFGLFCGALIIPNLILASPKDRLLLKLLDRKD